MAFSHWVRGIKTASLSVANTPSIIELTELHNESVERQEWTIVHGFYTMRCDNSGDQMGLWRLWIANENLTASDFSAVIPPIDDPSIFLWVPSNEQKDIEIKAARTIKYNQTVFLSQDLVKSSATNVTFSYQMYVVKH